MNEHECDSVPSSTVGSERVGLVFQDKSYVSDWAGRKLWRNLRCGKPMQPLGCALGSSVPSVGSPVGRAGELCTRDGTTGCGAVDPLTRVSPILGHTGYTACVVDHHGPVTPGTSSDAPDEVEVVSLGGPAGPDPKVVDAVYVEDTHTQKEHVSTDGGWGRGGKHGTRKRKKNKYRQRDRGRQIGFCKKSEQKEQQQKKDANGCQMH